MPRTSKARTKKTLDSALLASAAVDPAAKKAYEGLLREIEDADRDAMHGWDRKYEAAGEVLEKKLFLLSPHGTAAKWCQAMLGGETYRSVLRNVRVARFCSPDDEHKYGTAKLDAVLTYLEAKTHGLKQSGVKVSLSALRIPVSEKGKLRRLSIEQASLQQIRLAARSEQAGSKNSRRSPLEAAFAKPLSGDGDLKEVSVRVSDGKVHFGSVPLTALARFAKLIRAVDWEAALP